MAISVAVCLADIESEVEPDPQQFGSTLYRDPDAAGVFWSIGPASAAETCRRLRLAEVRNVLFAVLEDAATGNRAATGRALILDAGADDAQPWPMDDDELIARLRALHRRRRVEDTTIRIAGCTFYPERGELVGREARIHLTRQESALLLALASRPGLLITKAMCMLALYNGHDEPLIKIIDVLVCKLRKKVMGASGGLDCIETVWGQGYRFCQEGYRPDIGEFGKRVLG